MSEYYTLFLYFVIYSVFGWLTETIYCRILDGKWTNRGFMFGPYCPIYGFGALLIIYFLDNFKEYPIGVFILGMIFTSTLEYIASFMLEKMFNAKWWDYSKRKFNLNGRICLLNSTEFAILGVLLTYIIHPVVSTLISRLPFSILEYLSILLFCILIVDCCSTVFSLLNLKEKLEMLGEMAEEFKNENIKNHKEITDFYLYNQLSEFRKKIVTKHKLQTERILNAFPNFEFRDFKQQIDEIRLEFHLFKQTKKDELERKKELILEEKRKKKEEKQKNKKN